MQSIQGKIVNAICLLGLLWLMGLQTGSAQSVSEPGATAQTGYAVKKPIIGGACATCPWGAMSEVVKEAMQPYGWDIQICYYCAGGPREARMVAGAIGLYISAQFGQKLGAIQTFRLHQIYEAAIGRTADIH